MQVFIPQDQLMFVYLFQPWNLFKSYPFYMIIVVDKWHKWRGCHQEQMVSDKKAPLEKDAQSDRSYLPS